MPIWLTLRIWMYLRLCVYECIYITSVGLYVTCINVWLSVVTAFLYTVGHVNCRTLIGFPQKMLFSTDRTQQEVHFQLQAKRTSLQELKNMISGTLKIHENQTSLEQGRTAVNSVWSIDGWNVHLHLSILNDFLYTLLIWDFTRHHMTSNLFSDSHDWCGGWRRDERQGS